LRNTDSNASMSIASAEQLHSSEKFSLYQNTVKNVGVYVCAWMCVFVCVRVCVCIVSGFLCMGWLRLVGSLKLYVSFSEYSLFYRALLQKETYNFKEPTNRSHPISEYGQDRW